jgi:predicted nucleic acid-binding protein
LTIDLDRHLRRIKVDKLVTPLSTRPLAALISVAGFTAPPRAPILIDTNVYINAAAGRLPPDGLRLFASSLIFHSEVCIAELSTGVANADPARPQWKARRDHYARLLERMPSSRIIRPDGETWTEAGLIAGTLARVQHFQPHQRKECLNDALIYLSAAKQGIPVLTVNRDEFDLIQQIARRGSFIHY